MKYKLGDIAKIYNGSTPSTSNKEYWDGDIIWITPKDLSNQRSKYIYKGERNITKKGFEADNLTMLPVDSILLTSRAPIGLIAINKVVCCTNQGFKNIVPNENIVDVEYLYYFLSLHKIDIIRLGSGTTFKEVSRLVLSNLEIDLPVLQTQKQISSILKNIDSKIENNNKINSELESLARTIYDYWFLQFDFPNEEGKPYKSSGGAMEYNEQLKMEIPKGWEAKKIKEIVNFVPGYAFSSQSYSDDGKYKLYTIKNVQDGKIDSDVDNRIKDIPSNMSTDCLLQEGDLLMSLTGNVGRVGLVYEENVLLNQRVLKIVPKHNDISYIYMMFRNVSMQKKLEWISTGTSQKNLSPDDIKEIFVIYPPQDLINKYSGMCNPIIKSIVLNQAENLELASLRDYLLPLLMNGQVGFKDE